MIIDFTKIRWAGAKMTDEGKEDKWKILSPKEIRSYIEDEDMSNSDKIEAISCRVGDLRVEYNKEVFKLKVGKEQARRDIIKEIDEFIEAIPMWQMGERKVKDTIQKKLKELMGKRNDNTLYYRMSQM